MLAYVFWHWPAPGVDPDAYARDLVGFLDALGTPGAHSLRLDRAPFDGPGGPVFEDWYPVADWAGLGELNERAVSGPRRAPHDAVATQAGGGAGAVYGLVAGEPGPRAAAAWLPKPPGTPHETFVAELTAAAPHATIWQRQMVLGPAPEFAVLTDDPVSLPAPAVATRPQALREPA